MPKKTTILILVLTVVTALLVYLALQSDKNAQKIQQVVKPNITRPTPTKHMVEKTATVYFSDSAVNANVNVPVSVDLLVNSGKSSITGVQVELTFDPKVVTNVSITPPTSTSFFGTPQDYLVLFKDINPLTGKVVYAIAIPPQGKAKQGIGKIGTLTFNVVSSPSKKTELSFASKTFVTKLGEPESILKDTIPLTVNLNTVSAVPYLPTQ